MTPSERRIAHVLLSNYPTPGLESVTGFAARAKVSAATVQRFALKLGFASYPEFRARLRDETAAAYEGPLTLARPAPHADALRDGLVRAVEATIDGVDQAELAAVVALLADPKRRVHLAGGAFTHTVAAHLAFHLRKMRPGVALLDRDMPRRADALLDLGRRDVLVVFDVRRYQPDARITAQVAAERGARIVLVTDQWLSGVAEHATHVFRCKVNATTPWDTLVGLVALVETIAAAVDRALWPDVEARLKRLDALRDVTFVPARRRGEE
jgi:DNA-binding MurR/RpiR family transcriptional regulator